MNKYHYVYRITNKENNKHYYGVRSSKIEPKLDLGIKYFSSSRDKEFMNEQKINKDKFKYKVIKMFETREEAINLEIKLHNKFEVQKNKKFYNRSKQTTTKFDTSGVQLSNELKLKLSKFNKGKTLSDEHKEKIKLTLIGRKHSEESKLKMSEALKGKTPWNKDKHISEETKQKLKAYTGEKSSMFGKTHSEETINKMKKPKLKVECDNCGMIGGISAMKRWHFENCKNKGLK